MFKKIHRELKKESCRKIGNGFLVMALICCLMFVSYQATSAVITSAKVGEPKELGLRHRAALGISQDSDAIAIVVSEETGGISVAIKGEFQLRLSAEKLENILSKEMNL